MGFKFWIRNNGIWFTSGNWSKSGKPRSRSICISGDSSIQLSIQELGTLAQYNLGIKIIIANNGWQGMVRQWQESFYGNRFSNSYMKNGMPNFAAVALAYGIQGFSITTLEELTKIITNNDYEGKPLLIDVNVIENENCYPMVAPGKSNSQMLGLQEQTV